jgi:chemotaxis-related protein WspB
VLGLGFQVGGQRYALSCRQVLEVVPMAHVRPLPTAPPHLVGVMVYRGASVPVIDLCILLTGTPAISRLSTRIIVASHEGQTLGLIGEHVTEVVEIDEALLEDPGVELRRAPWLGRVFRDELGLTQLIDMKPLGNAGLLT